MQTNSLTSNDNHDDNQALRYLLHNVRGLSPVSGGVLGESLEAEYAQAEAESRALDELEPQY